MSELENYLREMRRGSSNSAAALDTYREIERVYHETLRAMGLEQPARREVGASANVTICYQSEHSTRTRAKE